MRIAIVVTEDPKTKNLMFFLEGDIKNLDGKTELGKLEPVEQIGSELFRVCGEYLQKRFGKPDATAPTTPKLGLA
jgi:hypothetical protein